jgi:ribosomal protein L12E/L44/L45/RPP1/RPP2
MATRSLGSLTIDLIAKTGMFEAGMDRAARLADRRSRDISKSISKGLKGALGSVAAFTTGLVGGLLSAQAAFEGVMNAINNADRLDELSSRLGISTEQLSAWGYAAKLSGNDLESLTGSIQKFSKTVASAADANSRQAELFASLGINVKDAAGNLRDVEELLPEVADRFKQLNNDTTEAALAQELFGRSGAELLEFLNRGSDGLRELGDEAKNLGAIIDGDTAKAAAAFNDELDKLRFTTNGYFTSIAREVLPALTELIREFRIAATQGENLNRTATLVKGAFDALASAFDFFSKTARINQAIFNTYNNTLLSVYNTMRGIASLDFSRAGTGIRSLINGLRAGFDQATGNAPSLAAGRARNARGGSNRPETGGNFSGLQNSVNAFLSNADAQKASRSRKAGLSEEQREAERLKQSYDSLVASMTEQVALFGQTTEAAKIRYDLENGELAKLNPLQKENLLNLAEQIDTQKRLKELQDAADDRLEKETEAYERNREANAELIADMRFELELLGMTNEERNKAIALRYLSADATDEERKAVLDLADAQVKASESAELWDGIQRSLADGLFDAITGAESLTDAVRNFFEEVANMLLRQTLEKLSQQITDAFQASANSGQSGGGWGAAISNFFSTAFGGARANGGPVQAGVPYLVGERGPELFVAPKTGTIIPNNKMGMGLTQVNNFMVQGRMDRRTEDQIAADVGRKSSTALRRNS